MTLQLWERNHIFLLISQRVPGTQTTQLRGQTYASLLGVAGAESVGELQSHATCTRYTNHTTNAVGSKGVVDVVTSAAAGSRAIEHDHRVSIICIA